MNSIEINGTFYSLQRPESFRAWKEATPEGFVFAIKGSRYITHLKRLQDIGTALPNFFASGVLLLEEKLGPFLWQFPPSFRYDPGRFAEFFRVLPRSTKAAADLARHHDDRMRGRSSMRVESDRPLRHAVEVRHPSFACTEFVRLLREHDIGLVIADTAGKWPFMEDITSDFGYIRLHGDEELYVSGYTDGALATWADKIRHWAGGTTPKNARLHAPVAPRRKRDVYVYFDNDVKVHAPFDAMKLGHLVGVRPAPSVLPPVEVTEEARRGWPAIRKSRTRAK